MYKLINDKHCFNTNAICEILDINASTLHRWKENGCPQEKRGYYSLKDVLTWRGLSSISSISTYDNIAEKSLQEQKLFHETKLKQVQAEAQELKNKISSGEYLNKDDVIQELNQNFEVLERSLNTLISQISLEINPYIDIKEAHKINDDLKETVKDFLLQMSDNINYEPTIKRRKKRI